MESSEPLGYSAEELHPILPKYQAVMETCRQLVIDKFSTLFVEMFSKIDDLFFDLAEHADTNVFRSHCFEVMHEVLLRRPGLEKIFLAELGRGFENFCAGRLQPLWRNDQPRVSKLSLVEKEEYEVSLSFKEAGHRAETDFMALLYLLDKRLAIVNGGVKLGESNPALPGGPSQVCAAFHNAFDTIELPIHVKIRTAVVRVFEHQVVMRSGPIYEAYNACLAESGILPNLSLESWESGAEIPDSQRRPAGHAPGSAAAPQSPEVPESQAEVEEKQLFQQIQDLLSRRHGSVQGAARVGAQPSVVTNPQALTALLNSLSTLQNSSIPGGGTGGAGGVGAISLDSARMTFQDQVERLAELVQQQQIAAADADIIDLVGMLFEFILNDQSLPDSVKALLCHLHTPYLKVAILDRRFFFRSKHPARRLLNLMTQAGAACNTEETGENSVYSKLKETVERILDEFDDNTELFQALLNDFSDFMDRFSRRSKLTEKRSIEAAQGRERLREARQTVSQEIVDKTWDRQLPKAAEELLMGPWANHMVLTLLRHGRNSDEWRQACEVVEQIVWSVEPKSADVDRERMRRSWPQLQEALRNGLAMVGDPDINVKQLIANLETNQSVASTARSSGAPSPTPHRPAPPEVHADKALWDDIEAVPVTPETPLLKSASPEVRELVKQLLTVKLGTWFELCEDGQKEPKRVKLSWYSPKTGYYIFVNQAGLQVAIKPLKVLVKDMTQGRARMITLERMPFMERAMKAIYGVLDRSGGRVGSVGA